MNKSQLQEFLSSHNDLSTLTRGKLTDLSKEITQIELELKKKNEEYSTLTRMLDVQDNFINKVAKNLYPEIDSRVDEYGFKVYFTPLEDKDREIY